MFGDIIKQLRKSRNLNQVQLADYLGVSKQTVSNWENNNILPSIDMLVKVATFFSVQTDYLLELDSRTILDISEWRLEEVAGLQLILYYGRALEKVC